MFVAEPLHFRASSAASLDVMEAARDVLDRLERIQRLDREGAPTAALLDELRRLVCEAERWAEREGAGAERATRALQRCREALAERGRPLIAR